LERRTRYDIYRDTLEAIRRTGLSGITRISYGANLPVDRARDVLTYLSERNLVKEELNGQRKAYRMTPRGGEFLQALQTVDMYLG
jgi:predicted transcriptional regulator